LSYINENSRTPVHKRRMPELSFRCPDTGLRVLTWTTAKDAADDVYETVTCAACQRTHLVNVKSGRVLGSEKDTGRSAASGEGVRTPRPPVP
jgi:hypothetical protein